MAFGAGGGSPDEVKGDINVTPLVDVCLVLLIIFMVVTPMLQSGVDVLLPEGAHTAGTPGQSDHLVLVMNHDGNGIDGQAQLPDTDVANSLTTEPHKRAPPTAMMTA